MNEKEFYKKLYPHLFSDSKVIKKGKLTREVFSYFLDTLTSESRENEFEVFCRKIIQSTICPNLLPQTGATGGGDSKVDSETYPVASSIAESWLYGYSDSAHSERWAFAFSAKKEWKSKFKSDVKKIVGTNINNARGYVRIFFVTNQYVSDKKRAESEDELKEEYKLDIRILDRNWLLEKTFEEDNIRHAISAFNMSEGLQDALEEGSEDIRRKRELNDIEEKLSNIEKLKPAYLIDLAGRAVELNRELEVDKTKIIAVLDRNLRFSNMYGHRKDTVDALYQYCWTILWWYEDLDVFYRFYLKLEEIYKQFPDDYSILSKISTLWIILLKNHRLEKKSIVEIEKHTELIIKSYQKFIEDDDNPKRAKLALFDYQIIRLQDSKEHTDVLDTYIKILEDMEFNNDINLSKLEDILELPLFKEEKNYDILFELLIEKLSEQSKNIELSRMLLSRGDDFLENNVYGSIKFYSRALTSLYNDKSKTALIDTYMKLGYAFEEIGLLWAARSYYIRAFTDSSNYYFSSGIVLPALFMSARYAKYLGLRLGHVVDSVNFYKLEMITMSLYPGKLDDEKELERHTHYDGQLAIMLLNFKQNNLERAVRWPDLLGDNNLHISSAALKYLLGYYDEELVDLLGSKESLDDYMVDLYNSPLSRTLASYLEENIFSEESVLRTKIAGCDLSVIFNRKRILQEVAASLIAMLENVFATSIYDQIMPMLSEAKVYIKERTGAIFDVEVSSENNKILFLITNIESISELKNRIILAEKFNLVLSVVLVQMIPCSNDLKKFDSSLVNEKALFRAINCSSTLDTFIIHDGVCIEGNTEQDLEVYTNMRGEDIFKEHIGKESSLEHKKKIEYVNATEVFDFSKAKHNQVQISDVIYLPLWEKAGWSGFIVASDKEFIQIPVVGLVYKNKEGLEIFRKWKEDAITDKIKVGIIKGIDKENPFWYRVIIGEDFENYSKEMQEHEILYKVSRVHTIEAKNNFNLSLLRTSFLHQDSYYFIPVLQSDLKNNKLRFEEGFAKYNDSIIIKDVVDITAEDFFLLAGITKADKPLNNTGEEIFVEKYIGKLSGEARL